MNKPAALKVVVAIAWVQLVMGAIAFAVAVSCVMGPAEHGFWLGLQDGVARGLSSARDARSFGAEQFGEATAHVVISLIFPLGVQYCIRARKRGGLIAFLAVGIVVALGQRSIPLLTIIALVAACRKSVSEYLGGREKRPNQPSEPTAMSVTPPAAQEPRQP